MRDHDGAFQIFILQNAFGPTCVLHNDIGWLGRRRVVVCLDFSKSLQVFLFDLSVANRSRIGLISLVIFSLVLEGSISADCNSALPLFERIDEDGA